MRVISWSIYHTNLIGGNMQSLTKVYLKNINTDDQSVMYVNPRTMKFYTEDALSDSSIFIEEDTKNSNQPLLKKDRYPKVIKFFLGNACNSRCSYCRQWEHGELKLHIDSEIDKVVAMMLKLIDMDVLEKIQFWGGEPLLYIEDIKKIVSKLPKGIRYHFITNGILMDENIYNWMRTINYQITFSYDGQGQPRRGVNPLDNPVTKKYLRLLNEHKSHPNAFVVGSVLTDMNLDIYALMHHHIEVFEDPTLMTRMELAIPYNPGAASIVDKVLQKENVIDGLLQGLIKLNSEGLVSQIIDFTRGINSFVHAHQTPGYCLDLHDIKCGEANVESACFDWDGLVYPCQVYGGTSNFVGHIDNYPILNKPEYSAYMKNKFGGALTDHTCSDCLVAAMCRGVCPYLEPQYVNSNCQNKYIFFMVVFKFMMYLSGHTIEKIELITSDASNA